MTGFELKTEVVFGVGASKNLGRILKERGFSKALVFVDAALSKSDGIVNIAAHVKEHIDIHVFENSVAEPDYEYLDNVKNSIGDGFDCVVGIGGGSTLDLSKGVAVLLTNQGKAIQYRGFEMFKQKPVPIVAIPTTAGTGSEVTPNASFIDRSEQRKLGINGKDIAPMIAVLDPLLIVSCPKGVTVSSGMDVLVHCVESFVSKSATPLSKEFSRIAFQLAFNCIAQTVEDPSNIDARAKMLLASHYAGISIMLAGGGPAAGLSYPLGVYHKVPHGMAGAVFLARVIETNVKNGCVGYADLYDLIDGSEKNITIKEKNVLFGKSMHVLAKRIGVPDKLNSFGVDSSNIKALVDDTMTNMRGALDANPIPFGRKEVEDILHSMI